MRYSLFIMLGLTFVVTANANAAIYKGHIFYTEDCRSCHQQGDEIPSCRTTARHWQKPICRQKVL